MQKDARKYKVFQIHNIVERLYAEFPEYPFLRSPLMSHDNIIIVSVYGHDVFAIDSVYRKAELYVFTRIKYHKESIVSEINHRVESLSQFTNL